MLSQIKGIFLLIDAQEGEISEKSRKIFVSKLRRLPPKVRRNRINHPHAYIPNMSCKGNTLPLTSVSASSTIFSDVPCSTYTYKIEVHIVCPFLWIFFGPFEATEARILKIRYRKVLDCKALDLQNFDTQHALSNEVTLIKKLHKIMKKLSKDR
uniref:Uncharacterized protein n=1 Tax=Glossina pallidipes TaxID=7398 RepID=A0A1B0A2A8_GLOPL